MVGKLAAVSEVPVQRGFGIAEAARYLGMCQQKLRQLSDLGDIPCRRVGRNRLFLLDDLNAWLDSRENWVSNGNS
jgi:excisionase family DNA binding protein